MIPNDDENFLPLL